MTPSADTQTTRELAQRLLAYETVEAGTVEPDMQALHRVCDKLRRPLTTLAGAAGFHSLLARALTLAKKESPLLSGWEVRSDGSLQGMNGEAVQSGAVLLAHFIGLMITLIGEPLTIRLVQDAWLDLPESQLNIEGGKSE